MFRRDVNVANAETQILVTIDVVDGHVPDFLVDIKIRVLRNLEHYIEVGVPAHRRMELDGRVIAVDIEIDMRFFQTALVPRLDRVLQLDPVRVASLDADITDAESHMQVTAGDELPRIAMRLFIFPDRK